MTCAERHPSRASRGCKARLMTVARACLPAGLWQCLERRVLQVRYSGDYASWDAALADADGYDTPLILERVAEATRKVRRGEAAMERDGIALDRAVYPWPIVYGLLCAAVTRQRLHVVDFGGGLGGLCQLLRPLLPAEVEVRWGVIEQPHYVALGRAEFADEHLRFFEDADACRAELEPHVLILSSVLAYLPQPYQTLRELLGHAAEYVLIDRTLLVEGGDDRLTVQRVPRGFYGRAVSYPAWLLGRDKLLDAVHAAGYDVVGEFDALAGRVRSGDQVACDTALVCRRRAAPDGGGG
mgnify:FL=1